MVGEKRKGDELVPVPKKSKNEIALSGSKNKAVAQTVSRNVILRLKKHLTLLSFITAIL